MAGDEQEKLQDAPRATCEDKPGHKKFGSYNLPDWVRHPLKARPQPIAVIFPGEQNHSVGMLREVRHMPAVRDMLQKAEKAFGFDIEALMKDGPASRMRDTAVNQPIMYVADCAAYELLKEQMPGEVLNLQAAAGFSIGEYAALYAAGVITFEQGLEVVKVRAAAMQALAESVEMEAMVVRGIPQDKIERHMKAAQKLEENQGLEFQAYIARHWCPDGLVIAGRRSSVLKLRDVLDRDASDVEVRLLPDHLHAGHTPMAKDAAAAVAVALDRLLPTMQPPRCELYLNHTGWRVPPGTNPEAFLGALKQQLTTPLLWQSCVTQMLRWGIRQFYECGPNRSLRFMMSYYEHVIEAPLQVIRPADFTTNVLV